MCALQDSVYQMAAFVPLEMSISDCLKKEILKFWGHICFGNAAYILPPLGIFHLLSV